MFLVSLDNGGYTEITLKIDFWELTYNASKVREWEKTFNDTVRQTSDKCTHWIINN